MILVQFLFFIFTLFIFFKFTEMIFNKIFNLNFLHLKKNFYFLNSFFYIFVQFFFGLLILYTLTNIFFVLNLNINHLVLTLSVILIIFLFISFKNLKIILDQQIKFLSKISIKNIYIFIKENNYYKILLFCIFLILLNRLFLDWNDEDEIKIYGYMTRLFSEGWIIKDGVFEPFTRYGELSNSIFYKTFDNFFFIRFIRILQFIGVLFIFFSFVKFVTKKNSISYLCLILLALTPEFSYVGYFSLKTDFQLFVFEMLSLIFLLFFIKIIMDHNKIESSNEIQYFLITISLLFASVAFATRLSGLYILILSCIFFLFFCFKNFNFIKKKKINVFVIIIFCASITIPHLINHIIDFRNPFYPLDGIWNNLFSNPKFDSFWNINTAKKNYNINLGVPIINEFYIIFYNSLPFSKTIFSDYVNFLPQAPDKASSGWFNPVLLILFIVPFYFKKSKLLIYIFLVFSILFVFWTQSIQFVRVFLAGSSLSIIMLSIILALQFKNGKILFFTTRLAAELTIILLMGYHFLLSIKNNPSGIDSVINEKKRYYYNLAKSQHREKWDLTFNFKNSLKGMRVENLEENLNYINLEYFTHDDIKIINKKLDSFKYKVLIRHNIYALPYLETVINKGYVIRDNENGYKVKKILKSKDKIANCFMGKNITKKNHYELIYTNNKIKLICEFKN